MRTDPPEHGPMRRIVAHSFTPRAITTLESRVRTLARELIDRIDGGSVTDVVATLSAPFTTFVIAELMGVPRERWADFWEWTDSAIFQVDAGRDDPVHARRIESLMEFFGVLLAERRARPGDDIISDLVANEGGGPPLTELDLLTYCKFLLVAGTETTRNLISGGVELLSTHPDQRRMLIHRHRDPRPGHPGRGLRGDAVREREPGRRCLAGSRPLRHHPRRGPAARRVRLRSAHLPGRLAGPDGGSGGVR
jgi:cytochrome P450